MHRFHQLLFTGSVVALSWLAMMAVHELGHALGAVVTGGEVQRIVLHPLAISRTDVLPNPHPGVVVWFGPIVGCVLPLVLFAMIPRRFDVPRKVAGFFAGFCLIANGAYIAFGSLSHVGDCREMYRTGTPYWAMFGFGAVALSAGFTVWHGLGSPRQYIRNPSCVTRAMAYWSLAALVAVAGAAAVLFPQ